MNYLLRLAVILAFVSSAPMASAVSVGQLDTFASGTTAGWQINAVGIGSPPAQALPRNIPSGGPEGSDDAYLQLTSLGTAGSGGRLSAINLGQWAGNYLASGVHAIRMDVNNFGTSELSLRLLLADPIPGPPQNMAISTDAVTIPAGSGWISITFPIQPSDLTAALGDIETALANATELRIFHAADGKFPGDPITALLGVDNIEARGAAVPEVTSTGLLLGFAMLITFRAKRRSSQGGR